MKKALSMVLSLVMFAALATGCSNTAPSASASAAGSSSADQVYTVRIADSVTDDSIYAQAFNQYFISYVQEHGNGRIDIQRYGNSQLGTDAQLTEALQLNTLEMALIPASAVDNFCPDWMALDLPFLYDSPEVAYAALDGDWGKTFFTTLEGANIQALAWMENGFRDFSSNKPIKSLADMKGLKMRVMDSPVYIETFKAFGASPTPMAFSELYSALQNGTVDGQDNGPILTYTSKFYEVQKYFTVSEYCYAASLVAASMDWWKTLPSDIQEVLLGAAKAYQDGERQLSQASTEDYISKLQDNGMTIIRLDAAQKQEFRDACKSVYEAVRPQLKDSTLIDQAMAVNETYK